MSEEDKISRSECFRVFCTLEKKMVGERTKQIVDEEATERVVRMMCEEKNKDNQ